MSVNPGKDGPSGREKRRFYVIAFTVAFSIDFLMSILSGSSYKPSMIGLAIMIAAALFYAYSLLRGR